MLSRIFNKTSAIISVLVIASALVGYKYGVYATSSLQEQVNKEKPILTVAGIVFVTEQNKFALIERGKAPDGIALFGGHVEPQESPEDAFIREAKEELRVNVENLTLLGLNGNFGRDPRQLSVEGTYFATTSQTPAAGSDAKKVMLYTKEEILSKLNSSDVKFAFDHKEILERFFNNPERDSLYTQL